MLLIYFAMSAYFQAVMPSNESDVPDVAVPGEIKESPNHYYPLELVMGETKRLKICFCEGGSAQISEIDGDNNQVTVGDLCATLAVGDCVHIYGHTADCPGGSVNGSHTVQAINGNELTPVDPLGLSGIIEFKSQIRIPGCDGGHVDPPMVCKLMDTDEVQLEGRIMNRIPGQQTRLAMMVETIAGSAYIQLKEVDTQLIVGDSISIPSAGISGATIKRVYTENGNTYAELSDAASVALECTAASTEVGCLGKFKFKRDACGCIQAFLDADTINRLPLIGEQVEGDQPGCVPHYQIGHFALVAKYLDDCLNYESFMVAHGCVKLTATAYRALC